MKRILQYVQIIVLSLSLSATLLSVPLPAAAAGGCDALDKQFTEYGVSVPSKNKDFCTVGPVIRTVLNYLFLISGSLAVLFLIINGFRYMVSGGSEGSKTKARQGIFYAIIGIIVVAAATGIVNVVLNLVLYNKVL